MTMKISLGNPTAQMLRGMEQRIKAFTEAIEKAADNKFTRNAEICGFLLVAPRGDNVITTVTFNGAAVATAGNGTFLVDDYNEKVFGSENKFKHDTLVSIAEEVNEPESLEEALEGAPAEAIKEVLEEVKKEELKEEPEKVEEAKPVKKVVHTKPKRNSKKK